MKKTTKIMISLIACAAVMQAATAEADQAYLELRSLSTNLEDGQMAAFTDANSAHGVGLALGYELALDDDIPVTDGVRLLANFGFDGVSGEPYSGDVSSRWERQRLMASTDVGIDAFGDRVRPLVRLGAGYSRQSLSMTADDTEYRDIDRGFVGEAGGGLEVMFLKGDPEGPNRSDSLSLGGNLMMGYIFQPSSHFDQMERRGENSQDFQHATYDAGTLDTSGLTVSIGFVGSYQFGW